MEKKMETIIFGLRFWADSLGFTGLGCRVEGFGLRVGNDQRSS